MSEFETCSMCSGTGMRIGDDGDPRICGECHGDTVVKLVAPIDDLVKELMRATVSIDGDFDVGCSVRDAVVERLERYEWQPIETAPKDGTRVIAFFPLFKTAKVAWHKTFYLDGPLWACDAVRSPDRWSDQPSHWMPLPAAPTNV